MKFVHEDKAPTLERPLAVDYRYQCYVQEPKETLGQGSQLPDRILHMNPIRPTTRISLLRRFFIFT